MQSSQQLLDNNPDDFILVKVLLNASNLNINKDNDSTNIILGYPKIGLLNCKNLCTKGIGWSTNSIDNLNTKIFPTS